MKLTPLQVLVLLSKNRDVVRKAWELCDSIDEEWVMSDECPEGMCGVLQDLGQAVQDLDAILTTVETETEIGSGGHGLTMIMRQTLTGKADFQSGLEEAIDRAVAENTEVKFEPMVTMGEVISSSKGHFSFSLKDKSGKHGTEYLHLIGTHWRHSGNLKVYTVREIVWIGDLDLWAISADGYGGIVQCVRTIDNFMGKRAGTTRFTQIDLPKRVNPDSEHQFPEQFGQPYKDIEDGPVDPLSAHGQALRDD